MEFDNWKTEPRDIRRIQPFCDRLAKAWERLPDLRFGQLMVNLIHDMEHMGNRAFYLEDDDMIRAIEAFCSKHRPQRSLYDRAEEYGGDLHLSGEMLDIGQSSGDEIW